MLPLNAYSDASLAEFNLNLGLAYLIIDSILYLLLLSFFLPTMVDVATIDRSNCGANHRCCL